MTKNAMWDKFDKSIDTKQLSADVQDYAENGGGAYPEVPHGEYEVSIQKMELKESKSGNPLVTIWFKIIAGKYKNSMIFMNQVVTQNFQIHIVNEILRDIGPEEETDNVIFENYNQYGELIDKIAEYVEDYEYSLDYGKNNKGYNTFEITARFD
jgi:hypothetical protein